MASELVNPADRPTGYYENERGEMLRFIPDTTSTTLEFGCGIGRFSSLLKETLHTESWGVEIDCQAAAQAAKRLDKVIASDAILALKDIPNGFFDCVIFFDVLEHLVDPYSLLNGIKEKMTEKGIIVASIPNISYYRTMVDLVIRGNWDYKSHGVLDKSHLRFFTRNSIVKTFDELDFDIAAIEGMHATSSRSFKILNALLIGRLKDLRYKHYTVVAKPR